MRPPQDPGLDALLRLSVSSWKNKKELREGHYAEVARREARWGRFWVPAMLVVFGGMVFSLTASSVQQLGRLAATTGEAPTLFEVIMALNPIMSLGVVLGIVLTA